MTKQTLSIAARAIVAHVAAGGWIGASRADYIPAVRRLRGRDEYVGALRQAEGLWNAREPCDFDAEIRSNFERASA